MNARPGAPALTFEADHSPSPGARADAVPREASALAREDDDASEPFELWGQGLDCFEVDCL